MMLSDAPRYVRVKDSTEGEEQTAEDEAKNIVTFFQSNLKQWVNQLK